MRLKNAGKYSAHEEIGRAKAQNALDLALYVHFAPVFQNNSACADNADFFLRSSSPIANVGHRSRTEAY